MKRFTRIHILSCLFLTGLIVSAIPAGAQANTFYQEAPIRIAPNPAAEESESSLPLPASELDAAFEELDVLYPELYLSREISQDSEILPDTEIVPDVELSASVQAFLDDWLAESLSNADRIRVTLDRVILSDPDVAEDFVPACEEYMDTVMRLRAAAYELGIPDREKYYTADSAAAAFEELEDELKEAADLLLPFEEYAKGASRTTRARIRHVLHYLTKYTEDDHTLLEYYELGRYLGLPAEDAGPQLPALAQAICEQAVAEAEGVKDSYLSSRNKYNSYFGDSGSPWCAYFVVYNAIKAGVPDSVIPHTNNRKEGYICVGGCAALRNYMLKYSNAVWHDFDSDYTPLPGDIIYYGSRTSLGSICHVGIVLGTESDYQAALKAGDPVQIRTVEGNTSWNGYKSNCIRIKVREADASDGRVGSGFYVLGYLTPDYAGAEAALQP